MPSKHLHVDVNLVHRRIGDAFLVVGDQGGGIIERSFWIP